MNHSDEEPVLVFITSFTKTVHDKTLPLSNIYGTKDAIFTVDI